MRFLFFLPIFILFGCNDTEDLSQSEMVWVKIDMKRNLNKNTELVSDFGQMRKSDLEQIQRGEANEFVADDKVELFNDYIDNGDYTVNSALIVSLTTLKGDPVLLEPDSVLAPRAKELRKQLETKN
jgi:hypothetical protein